MRNSVRYAVAAVLVAGTGAGIWWLWNGAEGRGKTNASSQGQGSVAIPKYVPPPFNGKAQTELPAHRPVTEWPEIPAQPSDKEIALSRAYPRRLVAVDGKGDAAADNAAMGEFLRKVRELDGDRKLAETEAWLAAHPDSRWAASLRAEVADARYRRGWFAKARDGYHGLWDEFHGRQDLSARRLADEALGFLLDNDIGTGRAARLKELLAQSEDRPRAGSLESKLLRAKQAVYLLEHVGAQSVMCGPLALNAIQRHQSGKVMPVSLNTVPASYIATGIPLSEVQKYAVDHYKLPLTAAKRTDGGAAIPVPSVMHAREDHYVALTAAEPGKYFMVDKSRRFAAWVEAAAVNELSSGSFLVPSGDSPPAGFTLLAENEARNVFGRDGAHGQEPGDESSDDDNNNNNSDDPCDGMPVHSFNLQLAGLVVQDRPLKYPTPFGMEMGFDLIFKEMDSSQAGPGAFANTGEVWQSAWIGYVEHVAGTLTASSELRLHDRMGGVEVLHYDTGTGVFGPHDHSFSTVTRSGSTYIRVMPDGVTETYSVPDNPVVPVRVFLSSIADPAGNTVTFTYNMALQLLAVTDPLGQVTHLQYNHPDNVLAITSVTDPFSRTAVLGYDDSDRLNSITDQLGLTSTFTYQADGFMTSMTTPYGTTLFRKIFENPGLERTIEAEDPQGDIERVKFDDPGVSITSLPPAQTITVGGEAVAFHAEYARLQYRNSYYWSKEAWHHAPGDHSAAVNYRWMTDTAWLVGPVLEAIKPPLEERVWFSYPGMESTAGISTPYYPGMGAEPSMALRMLDAATPQLTQSHRNRLGRIIKQVDPLGRTTEFTYAPNNADVIEIRQTTGGMSERLATITRHANRKVETFTDAAGQTTSLTYNSRGQILTITDALGEVTSYHYDSAGCLTSVDGPLPGTADTLTMTYDALCRVSTLTDQDGYTVSLTWDNMDRLTRRTHPDATYEEWTYNKLDLASYRDRAGRISTMTWNALRQLATFTDPLSRMTRYDWCRCGDLRSLTDPKGRVTRWVYDIQGRATEKILPDGSRITFSHHPYSGWLTGRTDEKGQTLVFDYNVDGRRKSVSYPTALVATPSVQLVYDAIYGRLASLSDGQGTTTFSYHPITGAPSPGAGRLASDDGPWANDTVTYSYDALGRVVTSSVNGAATTWAYDAGNRVSAVTNVLGTFTATYDGATRRLASLALPGGGQTLYTYYSNSGTRRLETIRHEAPGGALLSEFGHTWDVTGRLTNWTQQRGTAAVASWTLTNDASGQLTGAAITQAGFPLRTFAYEYDAAGNRTAEVIDGARTEATYNALNQLTHVGTALADASYEWDGEDRLTAIVRGARRSEFSYDGLSRRVRQVEKNGAATESDARYRWCGYSLCEERSADGSTALRRFFPQGEQTVSGGAVSLYTRDHLKSVRDSFSTAGAVSQRISYDPWGRLTATPATPAPAFGFTGIPSHGPSGLHLAPFRAYDAGAGRWISRDPMGERYGSNLYLYALNGPAWRTDRTGLYTGVDDAAAAVAGAAVGLGGQVLGDLINGEMSGWESYAAAGLGGAVGGVASLYGGPILGGMAGGASTNAIRQGLNYLTGNAPCGFSGESLLFDTAMGGLGGYVGTVNLGTGIGPGNSFGSQVISQTVDGFYSLGTPVGLSAGPISGALEAH